LLHNFFFIEKYHPHRKSDSSKEIFVAEKIY
jgi:hypothetical protein